MKSIKHMYTSTKQGYWEDNRQTVFGSVNECLDVVSVMNVSMYSCDILCIGDV